MAPNHHQKLQFTSSIFFRNLHEYKTLFQDLHFGRHHQTFVFKDKTSQMQLIFKVKSSTLCPQKNINLPQQYQQRSRRLAHLLLTIEASKFTKKNIRTHRDIIITNVSNINAREQTWRKSIYTCTLWKIKCKSEKTSGLGLISRGFLITNTALQII